MNRIIERPLLTRNRQQGAVAIEFAVLFVFFFAIVYAIIAYSIPLLLTLSFKQISADAAREAVRVSPLTETRADYLQRISQHVFDVVDESWLPETWAEDGCPSPDGGGWMKLPPAAEGKSLGHYREVRPTPLAQPRYHLNICLQREYANNPIIPILPVFGGIPNLPKDENGDTFLRGRSTIRL